MTSRHPWLTGLDEATLRAWTRDLTIACIVLALCLGIAACAQEPELVDEAPAAVLTDDWEWAKEPTIIMFHGMSNEPVVAIDLGTGDVTLTGTPNEAAHVFWDAVRGMHERACCACEEDAQ